LLLDLGAYDELGTFAKVNPSLKSKGNVQGLWSLIDKVDMLGSDHAPHTSEEKSKNIEESASGFPGVETLLPLMVDCVNKEMLTWNELVRLTSHRAAEIFGLKNKGRIEVGADADLIVIDRKRECVIQAEALHSKCGWTPYENWTVKCEISKVFLRGEQIIDGQEMLTSPGFGEQVG
jgi:dihydroorotase